MACRTSSVGHSPVILVRISSKAVTSMEIRKFLVGPARRLVSQDVLNLRPATFLVRLVFLSLNLRTNRATVDIQAIWATKCTATRVLPTVRVSEAWVVITRLEVRIIKAVGMGAMAPLASVVVTTGAVIVADGVETMDTSCWTLLPRIFDDFDLFFRLSCMFQGCYLEKKPACLPRVSLLLSVGSTGYGIDALWEGFKLFILRGKSTEGIQGISLLG